MKVKNRIKKYEKSNPVEVLNTKIPKLDIQHEPCYAKDYKLKDSYSIFSIDYYKEWYKNKYRKKQYFLIYMILNNSKLVQFSVAVSGNSFKYMGGDYVIDSDVAVRDVHSGYNVLFYHQACSLPFKLEFNIDDLLSEVSKSEKDIDKALNPRSLKGFITSQVIEKVLKGQELSDEMKMLKILSIINIILTLIIGFFLGKSLGWF